MSWFNWKNKKILKSRTVTRARFLYLYVIFGLIGGLLYFVASFPLELPWHWALSPIYLFVVFMVAILVMKNWKWGWIYISDKDQGRLLLYLNKFTHFDEEHKLSLLKWVYLNRKTVRSETKAIIAAKVLDNKVLTDIERAKYKLKSVKCPQQLMDGHNEAFLVSALIYAHENIHVLDEDIRDIMSLTDQNLLSFNLELEIEKMKGAKLKKMMDTGKKMADKLKKEV